MAQKVLCRSCKTSYEVEDAHFRRLKEQGSISQGHNSMYENPVWVGQCATCALPGNQASLELRLQHELADLCEGVRRLVATGVPRHQAIAHLVEQQVDAEERDPGFRAYLELARQQRISGG